MRPEARDAALLWDMCAYAREAASFVEGMTYHAFTKDRRTQLAVERAVEIVGEAARKVSRTFQQAHPDVPWQKIVAQRHVLAHEYGEIKLDRVWRIATEHLPALVAQLAPLIPESPDSD